MNLDYSDCLHGKLVKLFQSVLCFLGIHDKETHTTHIIDECWNCNKAILPGESDER
jgi:hypothetical protein